MQRYRHYGTSSSSSSSSPAAPVEEIQAQEEEEEECEEEEKEETGGGSEEEVLHPEESVVTGSETKTAPVDNKNGRRTEGGGGGGGGGGPKYSMFTWFVVLALLGVWSSVAVVYFDVVDYDSVIARAQEFRLNFSEVLQGKLASYDTDGDGDFDVDDAKVLLGLTKDGGGRANAESLEEVLNILAEEGSDWIYGFFTFLYDVVSPPVEREEEEEEEEEDREVKGVILDLQDQGWMETEEKKFKKRLRTARPLRGARLRSALRDELRLIYEKMEAKRIARIALAEIRLFLGEEEEEREAAWALKMKSLQKAQEELRTEREKVERLRLARERAEMERLVKEKAAREENRLQKAEQDKKEQQEREAAWALKMKSLQKAQEELKVEREHAAKERERAERERTAKEKAEKERLEKERVARERERLEKQKEQQEKERIAKEKLERERMVGERERLEKERLERERVAKEQERVEKERVAKEKAEKERLEKERVAKERERMMNEKERLQTQRAARVTQEERMEKLRQETESAARKKVRMAGEQVEKLEKEEANREKQLMDRQQLAKDKMEAERLRNATKTFPDRKRSVSQPRTPKVVGDETENREGSALKTRMIRVFLPQAYHWYEVGHKRGHFASVWQRSLYNVDGLKAQPWWTPKETGYSDLVKMLERNWKTIRDEALAVMDRDSGRFVPEEENLREKGDWGQYTLWQQGRKVGTACQGVPKTCALMDRFPEATGCKRGQIKFSVMQPGTHVWPHTGPTNCRLRMHLGLVVPKPGCRIRCTDQTREWDEGKVLIFDDSFEHEVWQEASSYRLIFIVDVWHPELTQYQRQTLSPI
ncbi:aspartyl/asparaginyl beta-hydroxylase [Kryptolebias marmoratus]|nr:aspartyl/asparaginyl beta-hydroxylase [Kryptolebias marmoratus]